jgi:uncharacterized membrane protein YdjX (TVP38/TMEM64 family)
LRRLRRRGALPPPVVEPETLRAGGTVTGHPLNVSGRIPAPLYNLQLRQPEFSIMTEPDTAPRPPAWRRFAPLAALVALLAAAVITTLATGFDLSDLRERQQQVSAWVADNLILAIVIYTVIYALAVSISVPGAIWFTIGAGLLFGPFIGAGVAVVGSTIGATIIFLAVRHAFADWARRRFGGWVARLREGFSRDAFTYVLILRLIPVLPFFGINIAAALLAIPLRSYVLGTFFGVAPLAYVYATAGAAAGSLAALDEPPGLGDVLTGPVVAALGVFALVAILPWAYRRVTGRKPAQEAADDERRRAET